MAGTAPSSRGGGTVDSTTDCHYLHGTKPPPPYPYSKSTSNSTPDLPSKQDDTRVSSLTALKAGGLPLTASLGCLGSPDLSRTYENLSDLSEAVESLRAELTRPSDSLFRSFCGNESRDDLHSVYQVENGCVTTREDPLNSPPNRSFNGGYIAGGAANTGQEPIYQNVGVLYPEDRSVEGISEESRTRARSAPELDLETVSWLAHTNSHKDEELADRCCGISHPSTYQECVTPQHRTQTSVHHLNLLNVQHGASNDTATPNNNNIHHTNLVPHYSTHNWSPQQMVLQQHMQHQHHLQQTKQCLPKGKDHNILSKSVLLNSSLIESPKHPEPSQRKTWTKPVSNLEFTDKDLPFSIQAQQMRLSPSHSVLQSQLKQNLLPNVTQHKQNPPVQITRVPNMQESNDGRLQTREEVRKPSHFSQVSGDPRAVELERALFSGDVERAFACIPLCKSNPDFSTATQPENIPRNRHRDVVPYEENRVKITPSKDNKMGYINCSQITATVGERQKFYLCAQGPLANTVVHFWKCIWEMDVHLVVMLNTVVGDTNTSKSFPYWPQSDNTSVECGEFRVMRCHSTVSVSHTTSRLQLVHVAQKKTRTLWHLQYTDWGSHSCPSNTDGFIAFLEELSMLRRMSHNDVHGVGRNKNTPVLVHCSAGVGRSGVTVLCDLLIDSVDHNLPVEPERVLRHLRQQRTQLVQTYDQYKFVYQVLIEYISKARLI